MEVNWRETLGRVLGAALKALTKANRCDNPIKGMEVNNMEGISSLSCKIKRGSSKRLGDDKRMKKEDNILTDTPKGGDSRVPV